MAVLQRDKLWPTLKAKFRPQLVLWKNILFYYVFIPIKCAYVALSQLRLQHKHVSPRLHGAYSLTDFTLKGDNLKF